MAYIYEDELYHHGIKGQRWGIRRFQNEDGSLTESGKKRYGSGDYGNARFRPADTYQRSKNWQINRMGGRKINASYETRRARGEALVKAGRTKGGAVGRAIGRQYLAAGAYGLASAGLATIALSSLNNHPAVFAGAQATRSILGAGAALYGVSNIIKTYQDISDINTYQDSKVQKNGR